jgi:transposase InsO family protein
MTGIQAWQGFIYLATVIDCYSKKVVGWSIANHMRTELVQDALKNAATTTWMEPKAVFHTDRLNTAQPRPAKHAIPRMSTTLSSHASNGG